MYYQAAPLVARVAFACSNIKFSDRMIRPRDRKVLSLTVSAPLLRKKTWGIAKLRVYKFREDWAFLIPKLSIDRGLRRYILMPWR